jgi:hypothetical protein
MAKNSWYGKPGEEERTAFALGVHNRLTAHGVSPRDNADLYWRTIDERLATIFPDKNGSNGNGADREDMEDNRSSRPLAVAGGTRSAGAATPATRTRVIRLSESQVRVARRLGITPEQYAQQLALEEKGAANA